MKANELRKIENAKLEKNVQDLKKKLSDTRFKFSANQLKNVKEISNIKKEIATILTILREREVFNK